MFWVKIFDLLFATVKQQLVTVALEPGAIKTNDHSRVAECHSHLTMLSSISQNQTKIKYVFRALFVSLFEA